MGSAPAPTQASAAVRQRAAAARERGSIAGSSARNAATNALANTGKGSASSGAAVSTSQETMVPLAAFTKFGPGNTPLAVNHQGLFVATTISFNLAPGKSLSDAVAAIDDGDARRSACRRASMALSPAPRRPSSNRWTASRC